MERVILHSDMNNFYASVECMLDMRLRGHPVAVGGDVENRHGIILAKNYEAKKYGVQTGEALWQAKQKCKDLIIVPPHYEQYLKYSKLAKEIYSDYTDLIEPYGMDECWLDVSGSIWKYGSGEKLANEIRERMKFELGLSVSVGVSFNKIWNSGEDIVDENEWFGTWKSNIIMIYGRFAYNIDSMEIKLGYASSGTWERNGTDTLTIEC